MGLTLSFIGISKAMDDRAALLEGKTHEEFVFYAAGVGVVQTSRVDEFESTHGLDEDDVSVSKPKITKKLKDEKQSQRHFRGHDDDVRCLSVHALTRVAASGETGLEPKCMVWSIDARSGEPPMAVLKHPRGLRAVIGVAFDARGERSTYWAFPKYRHTVCPCKTDTFRSQSQSPPCAATTDTP
jgi:hypothetical protein